MRRPHATLSVLIYKRIIDVTRFTWQYSRNCRKNVTITRNLCYWLSVLVALCGNFHLSSSRLLFFTPHAIFAITLLRAYFINVTVVQNLCYFISAFPTRLKERGMCSEYINKFVKYNIIEIFYTKTLFEVINEKKRTTKESYLFKFYTITSETY